MGGRFRPFLRLLAGKFMENYLLFISEWIGGVAVAMIAGTSTKFSRVKLVFKYPQREGIVALGIFLLSLFLAFVLASVPALNISGLSSDLTKRLFLGAGGMVPVVVALWRRKQPVRSAGWSRDKLSPAIQLGLALAFLTIFLRGKFSAVVISLGGSGVLSMLAYSLAVVFLEETIFRGYIQPRLCSWWGDYPGWLAASALFVICQLPRLMAAPDQLVFNLVLTAGQALVAGFIMLRSGHVMAPALYRAVSEWLFFVV
jgi:membrane protease YdiL (CAAX protease family)